MMMMDLLLWLENPPDGKRFLTLADDLSSAEVSSCRPAGGADAPSGGSALKVAPRLTEEQRNV